MCVCGSRIPFIHNFHFKETFHDGGCLKNALILNLNTKYPTLSICLCIRIIHTLIVMLSLTSCVCVGVGTL
jgi:hypothetical protein